VRATRRHVEDPKVFSTPPSSSGRAVFHSRQSGRLLSKSIEAAFSKIKVAKCFAKQPGAMG